MPEADLLILINPRAGRGRAQRLAPSIEAWAKARPGPVRVHLSSSIDDARKTLDQLVAGSRVAIVGGDGSLHHLLPTWRAKGHVVGLCAVGTGNDTARALGVHRLAWRQALALALEGNARPIDLAWVRTSRSAEPHPFVSSLAAGFDAAVAQAALRAPASLPGTLRYLWATLAQLRALQSWRLQVKAAAHVDAPGGADGVLHDGPALFASTLNTRSYGSGMPAAPEARVDDGELDLLLAGRFGRAGVMAMLPLLLAGLHRRHPRVRLHRFTSLHVQADRALPLAADGEPLTDASAFTVGVWPGAVRAVVAAARR